MIHDTNAPELRLSPLEARVLGVLVEKQLTVPDTYPLTLNALLAGCSQKTSREPVMNVSEGEAQMALDELRARTLVIDSYGASGRVMRYAHNLDRVLKISPPVLALLTALMLRGPQTPGELRAAADRFYKFPDISSLEAYLEEMANRSAGALAVRLPRQPGAREARWAHLLCGEPALDAAPRADADDSVTTGEIAAVKANVARLQGEVAELRALVERLYAELGVSREN
ncbi:MAG TPA: YceH family protein [Rhodocyclaceae bacterium]|nr:YceH family protein [Rhodocyclaceae bacterium]HMV52837.1 YceH family protein [Rhodocyclaceae bacterium]HMZ82701.1 YceH family protein [Rhodocyclaceae bacterium]HNA02724.1 YceH family protein [Rhodocyclaceae bacterium]HNB77382.1 YceH family protein [Rhodocyclaceae bacterium]